MAWDDVFAQIAPDGLPSADVGPWAEEKHRLLAHYATLFIRSMTQKWDELVYLDLFSGPGECRIRDTARSYKSSPTIIYGLEDSFNSYIFCDSDQTNVDALRTRLSNMSLERSFNVLHGDANLIVEEILRIAPRGTRNNRVLSFCFLDPYKCSNLKFETIRQLASRYMDFLILIPSGMDAHRNVGIYTQESNTILDDFFGDRSWRERWETESHNGVPFEQFVIREFSHSMEGLRYLDPGLENVATIRSQEKNLLLYRLVLYSRNQLGNQFWRETQKYTNPQRGFDF